MTNLMRVVTLIGVILIFLGVDILISEVREVKKIIIEEKEHVCREYILLNEDTVEVIYTIHESKHFRDK